MTCSSVRSFCRFSTAALSAASSSWRRSSESCSLNGIDDEVPLGGELADLGILHPRMVPPSHVSLDGRQRKMLPGNAPLSQRLEPARLRTLRDRPPGRRRGPAQTLRLPPRRRARRAPERRVPSTTPSARATASSATRRCIPRRSTGRPQSRTELIDQGKVGDTRIEMVSYGPDGQLQRTLLNDESSPLPRGFVRRRIAERFFSVSSAVSCSNLLFYLRQQTNETRMRTGGNRGSREMILFTPANQ